MTQEIYSGVKEKGSHSPSSLPASVKIEIDVAASIAFDLSQLTLNGQPPHAPRRFLNAPQRGCLFTSINKINDMQITKKKTVKKTTKAGSKSLNRQIIVSPEEDEAQLDSGLLAKLLMVSYWASGPKIDKRLTQFILKFRTRMPTTKLPAEVFLILHPNELRFLFNLVLIAFANSLSLFHSVRQ